ncbi:MAG: SDR family NAD(P)-dependent oxidoreductase [Firmicutes bacterium]|nr:SDR family NAD(P)-dependent oxidoreductase [Bacillota bacterium]
MDSYVCITGATGGLGRAFAVECAERGWDLVLTDLSAEALANLATALSVAYEVNVRSYPCDLTDNASREAMFEAFRQSNLTFWSLINVAGIDYEGPFKDRTLGQIRKVIRLNIEATLEVTRTILDLRDETKVFRLINVSSLASFYPMPVKAIYAASKRFLLDFSLALREELRPWGGTVTTLCPAGMPTTAEVINRINAQGLMGRITTKNVGFVVARTLDHALKGHSVYIPGLVNRLLRLLGGLIPPTLVAHLIGHRWRSTHQRALKSLCLPG